MPKTFYPLFSKLSKTAAARTTYKVACYRTSSSSDDDEYDDVFIPDDTNYVVLGQKSREKLVTVMGKLNKSLERGTVVVEEGLAKLFASLTDKCCSGYMYVLFRI